MIKRNMYDFVLNERASYRDEFTGIFVGLHKKGVSLTPLSRV